MVHKSLKQLKRHFQCRQVRPCPDHDENRLPGKATLEQHQLLHLPQKATRELHRKTAPATKRDTGTSFTMYATCHTTNDPRPSPSAAPAAKSDVRTKPNIEPATKSNTSTSRSTAPATTRLTWTLPNTDLPGKEVHQILLFRNCGFTEQSLCWT